MPVPSEAVETIEVDRNTAATLTRRAAERGLTVKELVAELVPFAVDAETISELDRRWDDICAGSETVPHHEVELWLNTWGTPSFKPWHER